MKRSVDQLKHIDRTARISRHHQIYVNQIYHQKLCQELNTLTSGYAQSLKHAKQQHKLEQKRKEILDITIQKIANERQCQSLLTNTAQMEQNTNHILPKINTKTIRDAHMHCENAQNRSSSSSSIKLPPTKTSCHLLSHKCQLYPCQPIHHYTSFITKDHDQTFQHRDSSAVDTDFHSNAVYLQDLLSKMEEKTFHQNHRQLAAAIHNQRHLAHRHVFIKSTKARLDEQSHLLHERLADKRTFGYNKEHHNELRQAIKLHLKVSAKFCA